jgi:predicted molibdopterin-dependent oxidoreductase YjgC
MSTTLTINGSPITVPDGASVLDAVRAAGVSIPSLCKDPDQPVIGACRTCLVDIEGAKPYPASCHTPVRDGMVVRTDSPAVERVRRTVVELTIAMGQQPHAPTATTGPSDLLAAAAMHGIADLPPQLPSLKGSGSTAPAAATTQTTSPDTGSGQSEQLPGDQARLPLPFREGSWGGRSADTSNPFFTLNHDDCILCGRCVVACQDIQHISAIAIVGRGTDAHVGTHMDRPILESICTSCGQCVSVCPTGAILPKDRSLPLPLVASSLERVTRTVASTCPYCGVGCGVGLRIDDKDIIRFVDDRPENGSSTGMLCVKGRFGTTYVHHGDRLTTPLIRKDGQLVPCSWDEALEYTADRLVEHRGEFASLASAKGTNEDGYVQQKFVRTLMGTNNIDHCTRLCHSPSVEAMLIQLGSGATSNSYEDYENAGCLMVIGCDPSSNHPVIASRMRRAIDEHGARLIVVNPRRIDLCDRTDLWLRPFPGTDVALFNALAKVILEEDLWDRDFVLSRTEDFDAWLAVVAKTDVADCARITGVPEETIRRAARLYARPPARAGIGSREPSAGIKGSPQTSKGVGGVQGGTSSVAEAGAKDQENTSGNGSVPSPTPDSRLPTPAYGGSCLIWGMGVTQHTNGTANAHALLNLALLTGQMGRFGSGVSPLRGQNNVQGCGDAGCIPDSLPGYQGLGDDSLRKFEAAWGGSLSPETGMRATDMIEQAVSGGIKAMYIVGENPLLSEPNLDHAREGIERLDFLVVQDIFMHETAELADVVLPAAAFAEKEGTFTNSERRVQRVRKAIDAPGAARPDWEIVCDLARRVAERLDRDPDQFAYTSAAEIFAEIGRLWPNMAGISHDRLDAEGGIQWPCPSPDHPGTPRMYGESFPRGLGKFVPVEQGEVAAELPDKRFPLILNTGRMLYHWHGGTITRRVSGLVERAPVVPVAVHPQDATALEIANGEEIVISSRRGEMKATVNITDAVRPGEVFVPFVRLSEHAANWLTNNVYDKTSRIPEYKVCAVRLDKPGQVREWRRGRRQMTVEPGVH